MDNEKRLPDDPMIDLMLDPDREFADEGLGLRSSWSC